MTELNLDDLRALRDGDEKDPIILNGEKFKVPSELPWQATLYMGNPDTQEEGFRVLLGEEQFKRFMSSVSADGIVGPTVEQMKALAEWLEKEYLGSPGKASSASGNSSRGSRGSLRPTSSGSTASS